MQKSTVAEIRARFDADVERFSNLETGQSAAIDSPLCLELIAESAATVTPNAKSLLDVGCGAGNYSLKLLETLPGLDVTLIDLSLPMLERARERISAAGAGEITTLQGDIREVEIGAQKFDIIVAAAVLHHLREEAEWHQVFTKFYESLKPGGGLWIFDQIEHSSPQIQSLMWRRYGEYLTQLKDENYRDHVFAYIEKEDTPRPLLQQFEWLREAGFAEIELLHKNGRFAAWGALKAK